MNDDLVKFITKARGLGLSDDDIKSKLINEGWPEAQINSVMYDQLVVPRPHKVDSRRNDDNLNNKNVIQMRSVDAQSSLSDQEVKTKLRIFDYNMMFLSLWIVVAGLIAIINLMLFSGDGLTAIRFPITMLIVGFPVMLLFLFRTREAERKNPELKRIAGRVHLVQSTQALTFLILLIHTTVFIFKLMGSGDNKFYQFVSWLMSLIVLGGTFLYYWIDSHKSVK